MGKKTTGKNEFANQKFRVTLVKEYIFKTVKVKGKEIKCSPDGKIFYPFD